MNRLDEAMRMVGENNESLAELAGKLAGKPDFMAYVLAAYKSREGLDDEGVARRLATVPEMVMRLALCKRPRSNSADFDDCVSELSDFALIDESALAEVILGVDRFQRTDPVAEPHAGLTARPFSILERVLLAIRRLPVSSAGTRGLAFATLLLVGTVAAVLMVRQDTKSPVGVIAEYRPGSSPPAEGFPTTSSNEPITSSAPERKTGGPAGRSKGGDALRSPLNGHGSGLIARSTVKVDFNDSTLVRDAEDVRQPRIPRAVPALTRFLLTLTDGSPRGVYRISIVDAFGKPLATRQARSVDGKTVSVMLDLRGLAGRLRLCISRDDEAPDYYPLFVGTNNITAEKEK